MKEWIDEGAAGRAITGGGCRRPGWKPVDSSYRGQLMANLPWSNSTATKSIPSWNFGSGGKGKRKAAWPQMACSSGAPTSTSVAGFLASRVRSVHVLGTS